MGELVDDDRFERFRWRQDQAPGEAQPAVSRRAAPAAALVADRDRGRGHVERGGVTGDLALNEDAGAVAEPRLEDCGHWPAIRPGQLDDELVAAGSALPGNAGSAGPPRRGGDAEAVGLAPVAEPGAATQPAPGRPLRPGALLPGQDA